MASLIDQILETRKITEYLSGKGHNPLGNAGAGKLKYCCPIHKGDNDPSFFVYTDSKYENFYCFGCIEENELIWTSDGLIRIADVNVGDLVLDQFGEFSTVIEKSSRIKDVIGINTGAFREHLLLTDDHICICVKAKDAIDNLPYLVRLKEDERNVKFSSCMKRTKRSARYRDKLSTTECLAKDLEIGDYILFPVIPYSNRSDSPLKSGNIIKDYTKGPKTTRIDHLPVNIEAARLYGLYLAEGSASGRSVFFSFSYEERDTLAAETCQLLYSEFRLKSSINARESKGLCEVICSKTDLAKQFRYWFGHGCKTKRIPPEALLWSEEMQLSLLRGYLDGDGKKDHSVSNTVSKCLGYGLFALSIQCGERPSLSYRQPFIGKDGVGHSSSWWVGYKRRESLNGFFECINGIIYYLSRISDIKHSHTGKVVDIGVKGSDSFTTKLGVVHNCKVGGNVINLYANLEGVSVGKAVAQLGDGLEYDETSSNEEVARRLEAGVVVDEPELLAGLVMSISTVSRLYLEQVDFDVSEALFLNKVQEVVDRLVSRGDVESLQEVYFRLSDEWFTSRYKMYAKEQEQDKRDNVIWQQMAGKEAI
tara:strand:+ start:333 stop:2111 length:1779 start_codon:yes stop_codon:yes gene_type:complete